MVKSGFYSSKFVNRCTAYGYLGDKLEIFHQSGKATENMHNDGNTNDAAGYRKYF